MAYTSLNAILGSRGVRRTRRARRSFDRSIRRRERMERRARRDYATPDAILGGAGVRATTRARRSYDRNAAPLVRRRQERRARATGIGLATMRLPNGKVRIHYGPFDPPHQIFRTPRHNPLAVPRLVEHPPKAYGLRLPDGTIDWNFFDYKGPYGGGPYTGGPSTLEALSIASLGIPGLGAVTTGGRLLGQGLIRGGIPLIREGIQAARGVLGEAAEQGISAVARRRAAEVGFKRAAASAERGVRVPADASRARLAAAAAGRGAAAAGRGARNVVRGAGRGVRRGTVATAKQVPRAQVPLVTADIDSPYTNLATAPYQAARAAFEDPAAFGVGTARGVRDVLFGFVPGIAELVAGGFEALPLTPGGTERLENLGRLIGEDFSARYGPLLEGDDAEFRRRLLEGYQITDPETGKTIDVPAQGVTPFVLDALIAAPVGRLAGAAARRLPAGSRVRSFATRPRPAQRISGGEVRQPDVSPNLFGVVAQRTADRVRARATRRRAERGDALSLLAQGEGAVTPLLRSAAGTRFVAGMKGRARLSQRSLGGEEVGRGFLRDVHRNLNKDERRGLHLAVTLGIRNAEQARREIPKRIAQIREARAEEAERLARRAMGDEAFDALPSTGRGSKAEVMSRFEEVIAPRRMDNIPELEALMRDADKVFTPKLREVADRTVARNERLGAIDPRFTDVTAALRAGAAQAAHLGLERQTLPRVFVRAKDARGQGLVTPKDLPDELYHVTTNLPGIQRTGAIVAGTRAGKGLGGDTDQYISLTTKAEDAASIANDLRFAIGFAKKWTARSRRGRYGRRLTKEQARQAADELAARAASEGWTFRPERAGVRIDDKGVRVSHLWSAYTQLRERHIGRRDPLILGSFDDLARLNPEDVGIIRVQNSALDREVAMQSLTDAATTQEIRYFADLPVTDQPFTFGAGQGAKVAGTGFKAGDEGYTSGDFEASFRRALDEFGLTMRENGVEQAQGWGPGQQGVEPVSLFHIDQVDTLDQLDAAVAKAALDYDQDYGIRFVQDDAGPDSLYSVDTGDVVDELPALLEKYGFEGATLTDDGFLHIMGPGNELDDAIAALRKDLRALGAEATGDKQRGHLRIIGRDAYQEAIERGTAAAQRAIRGRGQAPPRGPGDSRHALLEPPEDFLARLEKAREAAGLAKGGYFPSQLRRGRRDFSARTTGGAKAMRPPRVYTGKLWRLGIEDTRVHVMAEGMLRNIKAAFNWNLVADVFERTALENAPKDASIADLLKWVSREGIDENSVVFVNPERFRTHDVTPDLDDPDLDIDPESIGSELLDRAVADASMTPADIRAALRDQAPALAAREAIEMHGGSVDPTAFARTRGWTAMPKAEFDEITSGARQTALGRMANILLTQKPSRIILGSLNVPWLKFQVISNAFLTGLVGGVGPLSMVRAAVWWHGLSRAERRAVEPYLGDGSHFFPEETKLGAATTNRLVNAWRALKESVGGKVIWAGERGTVQARHLNPFNIMFAADRAQNNFFRRAIFYNRLRREAFKRMGENTTRAARLQNRIMRILELDPDMQMRLMLRERDVIERHARTVDEILGDYTTFTSFERTYMKRFVMFYSFIRFSLRLAFYTMPVKHPVMTSILGKVAQLEASEIYDLLGSDTLPYAVGRVYADKGKTVMDFSRANPVLNSISQTLFGQGSQGKLAGLTGVVSPWIAALYSQIAGQEAFTGKPIRIEGEASPRGTLGIPLIDDVRLRILAQDALGMFYPYRVWQEIQAEGRPFGADHLTFSPRFTKYKDTEIRQAVRKRQREVEADFGTDLFRQMFPEAPQPSADVTIAKSLRERVLTEAKRLGTDAAVEQAASVLGTTPAIVRRRMRRSGGPWWGRGNDDDGVRTGGSWWGR